MNDTKPIIITRLAEPTLEPDYARLVIRPFVPNKQRILHIIARIAALSGETVREELQQVSSEFSNDHADLPSSFEEHYAAAEAHLLPGELPHHNVLSPEGRLLAGAYFTSEYAFEATALFNPSIVAAPPIVYPSERRVLPDQGQVSETLRFIMSARSVGEGHLSSISFRTGHIDTEGDIYLAPAVRTAVTGTQTERDGVREIQFDAETKLSQRLLFPQSRSERNGMEDARFVRFVDDDGTVCYYAT
jgi:hypothetical protein